jgi:hypothetical protein
MQQDNQNRKATASGEGPRTVEQVQDERAALRYNTHSAAGSEEFGAFLVA